MLTQREQGLLDSLQKRLENSDALEVEGTLKELESSEEFKNPAHPDHNAFINMMPLAVARQMTLSGQDPHQIGTGLESVILDTPPAFDEKKELDFSKENRRYESKKANAENYLKSVEADKSLSSEDKAVYLQGAKQTLEEIETEQANTIKTRETGIARIEAQENKWEAEEAERRAQIKKDFMADRLKNSVPAERAELQKLADQEWSRLQSDYGF